MRLLTVALFAILRLDIASGIHAPFMGKSTTMKEVDAGQLRSCNASTMMVENENSRMKAKYEIACSVANSFYVTGSSFQLTDSHGDPETSGCYICSKEGTDQICADTKSLVPYEAKEFKNHLMFSETASCSLEASVIKGPKLKMRYARADSLKGAEANNFHVKTITNFLQPESDIVSSHSQSFYADTFYWKSLDEFKCHGCLNGAYLHFQGTQNQRFDIELFPSKTCEWIIFCFDFIHDGTGPSKCIRNTEVYLFLQNGIVHSGNRQSAFAMNLRDGRSIRMERTKESADHFWITSGQNERLVLAPFNTGANTVMAMSHNDCLELPIRGMGTLGSPGLVNPTPMDKNRANPRGVTPVKKEDVEAQNQKYKAVSATNLGQAQQAQALSEPSTTTEKVLNMTMAPTTEIPTQAPNLQGIAAPKYDEKYAGNARYRGWLTWAYFYGSLTGTLLGFLICGLLFFLIRRTVYRDWYRSMYKRYGCDASGTTGGVTGAEFEATTTGGNTTIGSTTAGATTATTMGETTGGTTSDGTTTGGATGTKSMITI